MAKKGQIFSKYNDKEKKEILQRHIRGESAYKLAKEYKIPVSTIKTWKDKILHPEKVTGFKRGRKKEKTLTLEDWKERYEIIKKYQAFLKAQREKR